MCSLVGKKYETFLKDATKVKAIFQLVLSLSMLGKISADDI